MESDYSEFIIALVMTSVGGFILYVITNVFVMLPGSQMRSKFVSLGDMRGKHKNEIFRVVGNPNSVSALVDGELLQWQATGYHIALHFQNNICQGISHEYSASNPMNINVVPSAIIPPAIIPPAKPTTQTPPPIPKVVASNDDEQQAKKCFSQAREFLQGGNQEMAIEILEDIVRRFPKTKAAASARRSLMSKR